MNRMILVSRLLSVLLLVSLLGHRGGLSAAPVADVPFSVMLPDGTFRPAPGYQPAQLPAIYRGVPSPITPSDQYVPNEVIVRLQAGTTAAQETGFLTAYGLRLAHRIYGTSAFVATVPTGDAAPLVSKLRADAAVQSVGLNGIVHAMGDPTTGATKGAATGSATNQPADAVNDPLAPWQQHLNTIHAAQGWNVTHGLGAVSLIAILDDGIDAGPNGYDPYGQEDMVGKYIPANWHAVTQAGYVPPTTDPTGSGTSAAGLAAAETNNGLGGAGVGYSAYPMAVRMLTYDNPPFCAPEGTVADGVTAVNWAADNGATVINIGWGCSRWGTGCEPTNPGIQALESAVERAAGRGITVVAAAGNDGTEAYNYPAAFGQLHSDDSYWSYDPRRVIAVAGTAYGRRHPHSAYGPQIDVSAPYAEDVPTGGDVNTSADGLLTTLPTDHAYSDCYDYTYQSGNAGTYGRWGGTSAAAAQVSGEAALLASMGYANTQVYDYITQGAADILPAGYDPQTGYGLIDVGHSATLALGPPSNPLNPLAVVPNAGQPGVQRFAAMGSHFTPNGGVTATVVSPNGRASLITMTADAKGLAGVQIGPSLTGITGSYTVTFRDNTTGRITPVRTFTVTP